MIVIQDSMNNPFFQCLSSFLMTYITIKAPIVFPEASETM